MDFGRSSPSISAGDCCSVRYLSDDHPFCGKEASIQPSREGSTVYDENVIRFAPSLSEVPPSGNLVVASVNLIEYIEKFRFFLDSRRSAEMHQIAYRLDLTDARYDGTHDSALRAWKKRSLVFAHNGVSFLGSDELQLNMPYVFCLYIVRTLRICPFSSFC